MSSKRIAATTLPLTAAAALAVTVALAPAGSSSADPCGSDTLAAAASTATAQEGSAAASGSGSAALDGEDIVIVDDSGTRETSRHAGTAAGVLRHAAAAEGFGTVYVNDVADRDVVTAVTPDGVVEMPGAGEAAHPTWSPTGDIVWSEEFASLKTWSPATGAVRTIDRPDDTLAVFAPQHRPQGDLVAVVQEPVAGGPSHDDHLSNLWRYDPAARSWAPLTSFRASADRWSVIRTPVVDDDGSVLFVRVHGSASATAPPSFELWRFRDGSASRLRTLGSEMYLAGKIDAGVLWNVEDDGRWRILLEKDREFRDLGCGGAMVDPRLEPDPDIVDEDDASAEEPEEIPLGDPDMAIAVGDFSSKTEAQAVALELGLPLTNVVGHADAPFAVAPGVFAVVRPFAGGEDMEQALADFRAQFPKYAEQAFIVSLLGKGEA